LNPIIIIIYMHFLVLDQIEIEIEIVLFLIRFGDSLSLKYIFKLCIQLIMFICSLLTGPILTLLVVLEYIETIIPVILLLLTILRLI